MFLLTGQLNEESVSEKVCTADDLIKEFNLKSLVDFSQLVQFDLSLSQYPSQEGDGGSKASASNRLITPQIQGTYKGVSYVIRYYQSTSTKTTAAGFPEKTYLPRRMQFKGSSHAFDPLKDKEEIVFWLLYKGTEISPLRDRFSGPIVFHYVNRMKQQSVEFDRMVLLNSLRDKIIEMNNQQAIYLAKGFRYKSDVISRDKCETGSGAKVELLRMLEKYPNDFPGVFNSSSSYMSGVVHDLIDNGKVSYEPTGGGMTRFFWTDNNIEIFKTSGDSMAEFFSYATDPVTFQQIAENAGVLSKSNVTQHKTLNDLDYINLAEERGEVLFENNKIYLSPGGVKSEKALLTVDVDSDWKARLMQSEKAMASIKKIFG